MIHFPYDCVKDFLESHPVIVNSGVNPRRIHQFLTDMLSIKETKSTSCATEAKTSFSCVLCKSKQFEINRQEGCTVCLDCGCVERYIDPDNCMYYAELTQSQSLNDADNYLAYEVGEEINHWSEKPGSMVKRSDDDKKLAIRSALAVKNASLTERSVSALLLPDIKAVVDFEIIKKHMCAGKELPVVETVVERAKRIEQRFVCNSCGGDVATRREIRHHGCSWYKKRKCRN